MKKSEISILISLLLCMVINYFTDVNHTAANIRNETLRLHIIADDDSRQAQLIKLQVRDSLQKVFPDIYCRATDIDSAVRITQNNLDYIQKVANLTLRQNNAGYSAKCSIEKFTFGTTRYQNFTMPRGEYTALTVRLGKARGKNWWCVAYPGLCISSAAEYSDDASNTFIETDSLRIKFKAVEIWEDIKGLFDDKDNYYISGQ